MVKATMKIVLSGGPGAGKTVVAREAVAKLGKNYVLVPESATAVYTQLGTTWPQLDESGRREAQRRMYQWQLEQELALAGANPGKRLLLDRGTIDGAAYWPDGAEAFWSAMNTTRGAELARYDAVIFLETAASLGIYDGAESNRVRFESADQAIESGRVLLRLWQGHPRLVHVAAFGRIEHKVARVVEVVRDLVR